MYRESHLEHNISDADYEIFFNLNESSFNEHNEHFDFDTNEGLVSVNNFQYYSTHPFLKLGRNTHMNQSFSLMHTNISSLTANFKKLAYLLADLDFRFNVIAYTETWNLEVKKHLSPPKGGWGATVEGNAYEAVYIWSLKNFADFFSAVLK